MNNNNFTINFSTLNSFLNMYDTNDTFIEFQSNGIAYDIKSLLIP